MSEAIFQSERMTDDSLVFPVVVRLVVKMSREWFLEMNYEVYGRQMAGRLDGVGLTLRCMDRRTSVRGGEFPGECSKL